VKKLTKNAKLILRKYLVRDRNCNIIENFEDMFKRVSKNIADIDKKYEGFKSSEKSREEFFEIISNLEFLPNIPVLANAGNSLQQLAACFVLPVKDSLEEIFESLKNMAIIQKSGGGTGFSFSDLRPEGSIVRDTGGVASGPVSFIKVFDAATGAIKEGGIRRGANMGILRVDHPDIKKFIEAKKCGGLENFNLSVSITDNFMKSLKENKKFDLIDPRTKKIVKKESAKKIFDLICENAYKNGEPGVIFIDTINRYNPILNEKIEATNPCAEMPLLPYESCILGTINLVSVSSEKGIDYKKLEKIVRTSVHFLDNAIDACKFPLKEIEKKVKENRKIGLGVMGFADSLIIRKIPYNSERAIEEAEKIMCFINKIAHEESENLAKTRGSFPNINNSIFKGKKMRNATLTTIAPAGTIGIIANCSQGIEPIFNVVFERYTTNKILLEFNPFFKKISKEYKLTNKEISDIAEKGTLKYSRLPDQIKKIFVCAHDVSSEYHVKIQAAFQKYTDNAVSKTVNLPENAKIEDVKKTFLLAYELKCKGITVYRDKSREMQVLRLCKCKLN